MTAAPETKQQPRHLIVTVYGLYGRAAGGWLSVSSLIRLLADLDVDSAAVRSSISRLKRRGMLTADRRDDLAGYRLSDEAMAILREGDSRIFRRRETTLADGWLLVIFSVPESHRHLRHVLRSELTKLGFGMVAPGAWIAPAHLGDTTEQVLQRHALDEYAELFLASHRAFGDIGQKAGSWWNLAGLERRYAEFVASHADAAAAASGREAFTRYVRILTDWRRLSYIDPGLPAELLPSRWAGTEAAELFFAVRARLDEPARQYAQRLITS